MKEVSKEAREAALPAIRATVEALRKKAALLPSPAPVKRPRPPCEDDYSLEERRAIASESSAAQSKAEERKARVVQKTAEFLEGKR